MSEKKNRWGWMLNTFYLWSEPVSCLPEKRPFLRLLAMTYVKQMRLVKKVSFFHARVDLRCLAEDWGWHRVMVGEVVVVVQRGGATPIHWVCQSPLCPRAEGEICQLVYNVFAQANVTEDYPLHLLWALLSGGDQNAVRCLNSLSLLFFFFTSFVWKQHGFEGFSNM